MFGTFLSEASWVILGSTGDVGIPSDPLAHEPPDEFVPRRSHMLVQIDDTVFTSAMVFLRRESTA